MCSHICSHFGSSQILLKVKLDKKSHPRNVQPLGVWRGVRSCLPGFVCLWLLRRDGDASSLPDAKG